ncbi:MAG: Maff2 family mobile element protein [Acutalibacteraceae bacterium]
MQFFTSAITTLQTLVVALGAGLGVWGVVNLLEGYGSDNPGSKSHDNSLAQQTNSLKKHLEDSNCNHWLQVCSHR